MGKFTNFKNIYIFLILYTRWYSHLPLKNRYFGKKKIFLNKTVFLYIVYARSTWICVRALGPFALTKDV